jgi:hypothetical protein
MSDAPLLGLDAISFPFRVNGRATVEKEMDLDSLEDPNLIRLGFNRLGLIIRSICVAGSDSIHLSLFIQGLGESVPRWVFSFTSHPVRGDSTLPSLYRPLVSGVRIPANHHLFIALDGKTRVWETWDELSATGETPTTWNQATASGSNPMRWDDSLPDLYEFFGSITAQRVI